LSEFEPLANLGERIQSNTEYLGVFGSSESVFEESEWFQCWPLDWVFKMDG